MRGEGKKDLERRGRREREGTRGMRELRERGRSERMRASFEPWAHGPFRAEMASFADATAHCFRIWLEGASSAGKCENVKAMPQRG